MDTIFSDAHTEQSDGDAEKIHVGFGIYLALMERVKVTVIRQMQSRRRHKHYYKVVIRENGLQAVFYSSESLTPGQQVKAIFAGTLESGDILLHAAVDDEQSSEAGTAQILPFAKRSRNAN